MSIDKTHISFDEWIKSKLESYEVIYNPHDWKELENKLDTKHKLKSVRKNIVIRFGVILCISTIGTVFYFINQSTNLLNNNTTVVLQRSKTITPIQQNKVNNNAITSFSDSSTTSKLKEEAIYTQETKKINSKEKRKDISNKDEKNAFLDNNVIQHSETNEDANTNNTIQREIKNYLSPVADFYSDITSGCENTIIQFYIKETKVPCSYLWDFGNGVTSDLQSPKHIYIQEGNYTVQLTVTSQIDNTININKKNDFITIYPKPSADFTWKEVSKNGNIMIEFSDETYDAVERLWDFGDGQTAYIASPNSIFYKKGKYPVQLVVKNKFNCFDTSIKTIIVLQDYNVFIPNIITPNGDGKYDTWLPEVLKSGDYEFELVILDANRNLVFKTNDHTQYWDGKIAGSDELAESGAYICIVSTKDKNGTERTFSGTITLLR